MPTQISKAQLINNVKTSLGWPTISLELEDSSFNRAVDIAVAKYQRQAYGGGNMSDFLVLSAVSGTSAYSTSAKDIRAILQYQLGSDYLAGNTAELFTFENLMWNIGALNVWNWGNFGLVSYHLAMSNLDMIKQMIPSRYNFRFDRNENIIYVNPAPTADSTFWIKCYSTTPASALYHVQWVYEWTKAECLEMLGHIRTKFSTLPGPGGNITLNGSQMLQMAEARKRELDEELIKGQSTPLDFFIG